MVGKLIYLPYLITLLEGRGFWRFLPSGAATMYGSRPFQLHPIRTSAGYSNSLVVILTVFAALCGWAPAVAERGAPLLLVLGDVKTRRFGCRSHVDNSGREKRRVARGAFRMAGEAFSGPTTDQAKAFGRRRIHRDFGGRADPRVLGRRTWQVSSFHQYHACCSRRRRRSEGLLAGMAVYLNHL